MTDWVEIGDADSVPRLGSRIVRTSAGDIAVFRTEADDYFALDDRCPHRGGPLSQGIVHGRRVTCPLHNLVVELETGRAVAPDEGCARAHRVRLDAGRLWLALGEAGGASAAA
jgi:nitrite reductase (NADH) small subunit